MIERIAAHLGHSIPDAGSVDHLNRLPDAVVADARRLHDMERLAYLRHVVARSERPWLGAFVAECVDGDAPVADFGRGRVVTLGTEPDEVFVTPLADALARLTALTDDSVRVMGQAPSNRLMRGAPAVALPSVDYRWRALAGTKSHVWGTGTEPVADPLLAGRRWLTTLLDFYAAGLDAPADAPAALLRQLAPDARSFSADALIAAAAWRLLRFERRPDQALGVLGDDALFQGPTAD